MESVEGKCQEEEMRGGQMSNFLDSVSIFLVSRMSVLASVGISV